MRDDGFHDLVSLVQTIDLCDTVTIAPAASRSVQYFGAQSDPLPSPRGEIIGRAWDQLAAQYPIDGAAAITVIKRIPEAAGLGGGSSDAGSVPAAGTRVVADRAARRCVDRDRGRGGIGCTALF